MATRFQSRAFPIYKPEPYQSGMAGLWNMISAWYSTSPEFRDWLASLFRSEEPGESGVEQGFDTTMTYDKLANVPEFGSPEAASDTTKILTGKDRDETNIGWLQDIGRDVRGSYNDEGPSVRTALLNRIPALRVEENDWLKDLGQMALNGGK